MNQFENKLDFVKCLQRREEIILAVVGCFFCGSHHPEICCHYRDSKALSFVTRSPDTG